MSKLKTILKLKIVQICSCLDSKIKGMSEMLQCYNALLILILNGI